MPTQKPIANSNSHILKWLQFIFFGSAILYFGRDIFVPISFAVLISFILYPICAWLERKKVGRMAAIVISLSILVLLGLLLVALLISQFIAFLDEWPTLQYKLNQSLQDLSQMLIDVFNISKDQQESLLNRMSDESGINLFGVLRNAVSASALSIVLMVLIPVYVVLILYYRSYWMEILYRMFPSERNARMLKIISLTIQTYYNFIKGMAIVYLIVGTLNSIGLLILGVPHAILFGFIASVLTFIPYVGIIVGSLLPIAMSWITYDSVWYPVGIIAIFAFVQYLEANVIFPLAVSNRLHVNTLVMLIAIFIGGLLWGMAGMILFVPFVGIIKLIADQNPKWETVSMMLGMKNDKQDEHK
ncbi:AI-2E family transporter [Fulvivirga kasyanovii]|uniref:AI-2E family transporter n=1 Tax=Fulvivirga kasyanovii TaxID=396812 RepID=A0ABW9RRX0_9BACT|nr:AI-2E family transporter [Fulvivirga kasyanovii]MTI26620.1 AI-2E family transporter [Fulvivirga kasyanovii]